MVKLNLRKLSAPIEALRPEVDTAYKRLDEQWDAVISQLKKLAIPCVVGYTYWHDYPVEWARLEFRKWKGAKRLCITSYTGHPQGGDETCEVIPFEEWSGEQRVQMLQHVPDLFENAVKEIRQFIEKTQEEENLT
jgi:hypothetical protein